MASLARKLSISHVDNDEIGAELVRGGGGGQALAAPTVFHAGIKKIHVPISKCKTKGVCVFSDRAQIERILEVNVEEKTETHKEKEKKKEKEKEPGAAGESSSAAAAATGDNGEGTKDGAKDHHHHEKE